jgi:4-hydroxy 2-oxovalerate aldolase
MKIIKKINLLDCTLRDGGYYNNWDFSSKLVNEYLKTMSKVGIEYVELGFRSFQSSTFRGSNWYTTDNYINSLKIPSNLKIVVMVNASQIINQKNLIKSIKILFNPKKKSKVSLVRIACHFAEIEKTLVIVKQLKILGYNVAVNLMQISEQNDEKIINISKKLSLSNVDIVYFADSLGCMKYLEIEKVIKNINTHWKGPVGVHMHNNLNQALLNNIYCLKKEIQWIDSTIMGMGRGAGNAQTEYFLIEYRKYFKKKTNIIPIQSLMKKYFIEIKNKYNWGPNIFYYLAGIHRIHPTYIQEMISTSFSDSEILAAIDQLKNSEGSKYNVDLVRTEFQKNIRLKVGNWSPIKIIKSRNTLLIASGPKSEEYLSAIETYIKNNNPYVIAVNTNVKLNKKLIDVYAACNPLKIIADSDVFKKLSKPLIAPISILDKNIINKLSKIRIYNFGVGLEQNTYKFYKAGTIVPRLYTLAYALSIATSGKAKKILLAGFDGYGLNDNRTKLINNLIQQYISSNGSRKILAITPTSYTITYKSIYNLDQ